MLVRQPIQLAPHATALFANNKNAAYTGPRFADGATPADVVRWMKSHALVEPITNAGRSVSVAISYPGYAHDPNLKAEHQKPLILKTTAFAVQTPEILQIGGSAQIDGCSYECVTCESSEKAGFNASPEQLFHQVHSALTHAQPRFPRDIPFDLLWTGEGDCGANADNIIQAVPFIRKEFPNVRIMRVSSVGEHLGKFKDAIARYPGFIEPQISLHFATDTDRKEWSSRGSGKIAKLLQIGEDLYEASVKAGAPRKVRLNWMVLPGTNDDQASIDFLRGLRQDAFYIALVPSNKTTRQIPARFNVAATEADIERVERAISSGPAAPQVLREIDYAAKILGAGCAQISQGRTNAPVAPHALSVLNTRVASCAL